MPEFRLVEAGPQLARSVEDAREGGFVGRAVELAAFADALTGASDLRVFFVHGPGGIGKTTLLDAFARWARRESHGAIYLDARDVECSPPAVVEALAARADGLDPGAALLVDGYELLSPLDRWFREELLPSRPAGSVTVLAGRTPPATGWRLDPGWRCLTRVLELAALDRGDSHELLTRLGVSDAHLATLANLGRGYPLALAMLADSARTGQPPTRLTDAPDIVGQLCRLIVDEVPDDAHRTGLATCAHATRMTEDLLARSVGSRSAEVWRWLESRPYVRRGEIGLFLHDVVRELFEAEFAQRAPQAFAALHRTVRGYFVERLTDPQEPHPDRAAAELLLMQRHSPLPEELLALREGGLLSVPKARPDEHDEIVRLVEENEGARSGALARRWINEQPDGVYRVRSVDGTAGFAVQVYLPASPGLLADDPVAQAVLRAVDTHGPLRPGERIVVNRFSGASSTYSRDPMTMLVNGTSCILEWINHPAAWSFIVTVDGAYYGAFFEYVGLRRMFRVQQERHTVTGYGWDRRRLPIPAFIELMTRRELTGETGPPSSDLLRPAPLSRPAFETAVHQALHQLSRADRLSTSALLGTALVDPSASNPAAALRATLLAAMDTLGAEPRGAEHRRVLDRTYLKGAPSQEAAAELLDLPFSTYRRHLARATERLVEILWAVEIGAEQEVSSN